jgi:hypothetical protein
MNDFVLGRRRRGGAEQRHLTDHITTINTHSPGQRLRMRRKEVGEGDGGGREARCLDISFEIGVRLVELSRLLKLMIITERKAPLVKRGPC